MKMQWWTLSLAGIAFLVTSCGDKTASNSQPDQPETEPIAAPSPIVTAEVPPNPTGTNATGQSQDWQSFSNALTPATAPGQTLAVPHLIPPTASVERIPQVETGRADPFATLNLTPTVVRNRRPATTPIAPPVPVTQSLPTLPVATVPVTTGQSVPPLPSLLPSPTDVNQLPSVSLPRQNFVPPQPLAQTIAISGVVEVGGKTSVIVQVPNEGSSRYAHVGEYLANGKVLIKRVEMGLEPVVILEQDGAEVVRSIGSGNSLVGTL